MKTLLYTRKRNTKVLTMLLLVMLASVSLFGCGKKDVKPDNDLLDWGGLDFDDTFEIDENLYNNPEAKITVTDKEGNFVASYDFADYYEFDYEALMAYKFSLTAYEPLQGCIINETFGAIVRKIEVMPDTGLTQITYYNYGDDGNLTKKAVCSDTNVVQSYSDYEYERSKMTEKIFSSSGEFIAKKEYDGHGGQMTNYETYTEDGEVEEGFSYYYLNASSNNPYLSCVQSYTADGQMISRTDYLNSDTSLDGTCPVEEVIYLEEYPFDVFDEITGAYLGHSFEGIDVWYTHEYNEAAKMYNGNYQLIKSKRRGPDEETILATFEYEYDSKGRPTRIVYAEQSGEESYLEYNIEYKEK